MMGGMPFKFFWMMPMGFFVIFLGLTIFLVRKLLLKKGTLHPLLESSSLNNNDRPSSVNTSSEQIPDSLKQAGQQVLENLDWDIRLLEKQFSAETDTSKKQEIEVELKRKKVEYQTTVARLEL
jgi:biopolymer transport protein ExbD